ncbi:MAG TPA: hypothetical protein VLC46_00245, partial [Thermoanaerobaculia bacterium]|nr:hypothetical protein [Thermoanaerobaculia bacterium]
ADEGALALAEQWTIFMNGRVETIENSQLRREDRPLIRLSAPSPPQETAGEKGSRRGTECRRFQ